MGMRAIPADRLLASHAAALKVAFAFEGMGHAGEALQIEPIVVFSPAMYLPAVIAKAEAIAKFLFGSSEVLGVRRSVNDMGVLGVEADIMPIDGSPQGILRSLLVVRASEQLFDFQLNSPGLQFIDLARVTAYYRTEGAAALRGERDDVISEVNTLNYKWATP